MSDDPKKQDDAPKDVTKKPEDAPKEVGGFEGKKEPTRYGDWEVDGRCSDF